MDTENITRIALETPSAVIGGDSVEDVSVGWCFRSANQYRPTAAVVELVAQLADGSERLFASSLTARKLEVQAYSTGSWTAMDVSPPALRGRWPSECGDIKVYARISIVTWPNENDTEAPTLELAATMPDERPGYTTVSDSVNVTVL